MREIKFRAIIDGRFWTATPESEEWEQFWVLAEKETIGQYTGLTDCNGQEIYEGDVLKLNGGAEDFYGEVLFENGCFVFNAHWIEKGEAKPGLYRYTEVNFVKVEVAGNIYENPELLE